jgi:hypothetical protein
MCRGLIIVPLFNEVRTEVVKWAELNERWIARLLATRKAAKPA